MCRHGGPRVWIRCGHCGTNSFISSRMCGPCMTKRAVSLVLPPMTIGGPESATAPYATSANGRSAVDSPHSIRNVEHPFGYLRILLTFAERKDHALKLVLNLDRCGSSRSAQETTPAPNPRPHPRRAQARLTIQSYDCFAARRAAREASEPGGSGCRRRRLRCHHPGV